MFEISLMLRGGCPAASSVLWAWAALYVLSSVLGWMLVCVRITLVRVAAGGVMFLYYNRVSEIEQELLCTKQARNPKASTFTRMAQQHHHVEWFASM